MNTEACAADSGQRQPDPVAGDRQTGMDAPHEVTVTELKPARLCNAPAAEYLGTTPGALAIMRVRKRGPRYHRDGSSQNSPVYYLVTDLDAWIADRVAQRDL